MILSGDIGGTNTRLGIFDEALHPLMPVQKFSTGNGQQLESQMRQVLDAFGKPIDHACLAVAGPVIEGVCRSTNIGRDFVSEEIRATMKLQSLTLINDLVANASGIELLHDDELVTVSPGKNRQGSKAVVSPGTGLGEAFLIWDGHQHRAYPSEGGHSRFAPTTPLECGLLEYLQIKLGDVIVEHVISGRGIEYAFDYLLTTGMKPSPAVADQIATTPAGKRTKLISNAGLGDQCDTCTAAMQLYAHILAIECASMAVKTFAVGGLYVGGGIPPKILPLLQSDHFRDAFLTHITLHNFLSDIPVRVILNDDTALEGACLYGLRFGRVS